METKTLEPRIEPELQAKLDAKPWAEGCATCRYGVVSANELTGAVNLYLERIVQLEDGLIQLCECAAGKAYWASLMNRKQALIEEARKSPLMNMTSEPVNTHPDIESARRLVYAAMARREPTIRYDGTALREPKDN